MAERDWDREREWERGRRYRGQGYYGGYYDSPERERDRDRDWSGRGDERGLLDRVGEAVRSWFGDDDAQHHRMRDEREQDRGSWGERRGWPGRERGGGEERRWGGGPEDVDREWARQWGYVEGRGLREPARGSSRGWGYGGGYGSSAGHMGGRSEWSGSGGYEPSGYGSSGRDARQDYVSERYGSGWRSGVWQGPYVGRGPRGYQRSDERIREDVCERLSQCGELDATDIEIRVLSGEVTLEGSVQDRHGKRLAEDLTDQVSGVREVHNQIRVAPTGQEGQPTQQPGQQNRGEGPRYRVA